MRKPKLRSLLHNTEAKTNPAVWLIIGAVVAIVLVGGFDLGGILPDFSIGGNGLDDAGKVDVNKKLQFTFTDKFAGTALSSKTIEVYDAQTFALLQSLTTTSAGIANTTVPYPSGTQLYVKYETSNDKMWFPVTVPKMNEKDAEADTYNTIPLQMFTIGTYTSDTLMTAGTSISDAGSYNYTASGTNPSFSYTLANSGNDNTGLDDSYDPIYDCAYQTWVTVKFSGTEYESVVLKGFDEKFTLGSAQYGCDRMNSDALSKWKVGADVVSGYEGSDVVTFSLDLSGLTSNGVTMQITAYAYADAVYAQSNGGSFGPEIVTIAEQTVTLTN